MRKFGAILCGLMFAAASGGMAPSQAQTGGGETSFRALYKELVETNTTLSAGDCTVAAQRMAARLKAAGYADSELTVFTVPDHPKEGGLVAVLPGKDPKAKALLLLAHVDVVEAKREDWTRDPFTLIEENGFFYARGSSDDKAMAAIFTDSMIRMRAEPRMKRTVKLALTCGEETTGVFNGAEYLSQNRRELIDAGIALNEGGGGRLDPEGKPLALAMQVAEKTSENYTLEARNPGGHSSMPRPDNAIYELSAALAKIQAYKFPIHLNPTTKAFFSEQAKISPPSLGQAMTAIAQDPDNKLAQTVLSRDPLLNSTLRTTCVATLLNGGHAENALPQRAQANINCRIVPGETIEGTRDKLAEVIGDTAISVAAKPQRGPIGKPAPLDPAVFEPARKLAAEMYPGLPIVPIMSTGATDSIYLSAAGIPTYGVPGVLYEYDGGGIHGLNEHIRVSSVMKGREYLYRLIRLYAAA
jgi:acetylornithine deacetylase/succinyl-diaminopimelate desuccinylase-like protein